MQIAEHKGHFDMTGRLRPLKGYTLFMTVSNPWLCWVSDAEHNWQLDTFQLCCGH